MTYKIILEFCVLVILAVLFILGFFRKNHSPDTQTTCSDSRPVEFHIRGTPYSRRSNSTVSRIRGIRTIRGIL